MFVLLADSTWSCITLFDFGRTDMQTDKYIGKALCNESY